MSEHEHGNDAPLLDRDPPRPAERPLLASVIDLTHLPTGARPMPFAVLDYDEVSYVRRLDCGWYGRCLDFVAHIKWAGFSCRRCPLQAGQRDDAEASDAEPVATVIHLR